ncbi:glycosyltransferase family 1 protein, partial [Escherichia coli]|nr:glycosyltransferase family 1 protein [Escherichia coli]
SPVVASVGRGPVSPGFPALVRRVARRARVVNLHLPMLEGALITALPLRVPVVTTYHIDLWLPPTLVTRAAMAAVRVSS